MVDRSHLGEEVIQLKSEVAVGTFVSERHNGVLTRALGSAEYPGRTWGVESYVGLRKAFNGNKKTHKPEGKYMTEQDLDQMIETVVADFTQHLPSLLQQ